MHPFPSRRTALRGGVAAAVMAAALATASAAGATTYSWNSTMTGAQQCAAHLPCDPDGSGTAAITANTANNQVCGTFTWSNISGPVGFGHIHQAAFGQPENVGFTINLFGPPTSTSGFPSGTTGCTIVPGPVIDEMARFEQLFMVTVHNTEYPGGPIRGQLGPGTSLGCEIDRNALCPGP